MGNPHRSDDYIYIHARFILVKLVEYFVTKFLKKTKNRDNSGPEKMGFIKSTVYLLLRYFFLMLLIGYHMMAKLYHTLLAPFEPIRVAAQKVPEDEITVRGIVSTVKRLAFVFLLVCATIIKSVLDRVMQPVYNIVENMSDFVERHTPPSRQEKVE